MAGDVQQEAPRWPLGFDSHRAHVTTLQTALAAFGAYVMCATLLLVVAGTRRREAHRIVRDPSECGCALCRELVEDRELREAATGELKSYPAAAVSSEESPIERSRRAEGNL